ncbi:hypothetical protein [Actinomyces qiguomingii]|nr:hypothetical protein [Actinomyces qiguomingii]
MISALRRGIVTECGCAGTALKSEVSWLLVSRNCVFIALLLPSIIGGM